jgi:hypothetical protein
MICSVGRKTFSLSQMDIFDPVLDSVLFTNTFRALSPRSADVIEDHKDLFKALVVPYVRHTVLGDANPWKQSHKVLRRLIAAFLVKLTKLNDQVLETQPSRQCVLCMLPNATCVMQGCHCAVHRECWLQWRLGSTDVNKCKYCL